MQQTPPSLCSVGAAETCYVSQSERVGVLASRDPVSILVGCLARSRGRSKLNVMAKPALDLAALTPDEKLELIDDLWGSLRSEDLELTREQRVELDRRVDRLDRDGPVGTPWEVVRAEMSRSGS